MSWFKKLLPSRIQTDATNRSKNVPEGVWSNCPKCAAILYTAELERHLYVCPKCDYHLRLSARKRLDLFLDSDEREELAEGVIAVDRLKFKDSKRYKDRLLAATKKTGEEDALVAFKGQLKSAPIVACAFEFEFIGGSMGAAVGERFVQSVHRALRDQCPFVCFSTSGGARMQEAVISLLQMAKTSAALARLAKGGIPYISVMTDPTYGGVSASLAMLGDLNIAEPHASIGFTGPRVIQQTVRETLPEGFQQSEFLLQHGIVDMIVQRSAMRDTLASVLKKLTVHLRKE